MSTAAGISSPLLAPAMSGGYSSPFLWKSGAILVFAGMVGGAIGSHWLRHRTGITQDELKMWERASTYAVFNGLGSMLISLHHKFSTHPFSGLAILSGGILFSGSAMAFVLTRSSFVARMTPFGGTLTMAGYVSLALL